MISKCLLHKIRDFCPFHVLMFTNCPLSAETLVQNRANPREMCGGRSCSGGGSSSAPGIFRFLGALAKLRKETISFVVSVCLFRLQENNSVLTERIFMKFDILLIFRKSVEKIQYALKSDKNIECFT